MKLNGKICIITGSAGGIGLAIARRYVLDGAKVAIADIRLDAAIATAATLTKMGPGEAHGVRANVICPGFVKTPLVEKKIPEQAAALGISEEDVVNKIMLGGTVDQEFTTVEDVAEIAHLFAAFPNNALTGQSMIVSHGWFME